MDTDTRSGSPGRDRDRTRRGERTGSRFDSGNNRDRSREKDSGTTRRIYISK